jgi:hypothetical protein
VLQQQEQAAEPSGMGQGGEKGFGRYIHNGKYTLHRIYGP